MVSKKAGRPPKTDVLIPKNVIMSVACGIVFAAFVLRVWRLQFPQLSGDEGFTYLLASLSYFDLATTIIRIGEPQPVASFFLEKLWLHLGGNTEFALRMLNVEFGTLAVALIWRLMKSTTRLTTASPRDMSTIIAASFASILFAISQLALEHSREYRTYAILLAFSAAILICTIEFLRFPTSKMGAAYVVMAWFALQSHYVAGISIAAINLVVLGSWIATWKSRRPKLALVRYWSVLQVIVLCLTVPWLLLARGTASSYPGTGGGELAFPTVFLDALSLISSGGFTGMLAPLSMSLIALFIIIGGFVLISHSSTRTPALVLLAGAIGPLITIWAISWVKPIYHPRYLIAAMPALSILAGSAMLTVCRMRLPGKLVTIFCAMLYLGVVLAGSLAYLGTLSTSTGWQPLISAFQEGSRDIPQSFVRVAVNMPDPAFLYYYKRNALPGANENSLTLPQDAADEQSVTQSFDKFSEDRVRRVLVHVANHGWWDLRGYAAEPDSRSYKKVGVHNLVDGRIDIYERAFGDRGSSINEVFANDVRLVSAEILTDTLKTAVAVDLQFNSPITIYADHTKYFLHLVPALHPEKVALQLDDVFAIPAQNAVGKTIGIPLPANLAAGTYELWFGLYDDSLVSLPRILTANGRDHVVIGSVTVGR